MPLMPRQEIDLTENEIKELSGFILEIWSEGEDSEKLDLVKECKEAYKLADTGMISDPDEYYDSLRVTLPTAFNALNSVSASVYSTVIPNNKYLGIERELTGDDLTKMILLSMRSTNWAHTAYQDFLQMGQNGDTYTFFRNKKNFLEAVSVPIEDVRVFPKDSNLSKTNVVVRYKLTTAELFTSEQGYIDESAYKLLEMTKGAGKTDNRRLNDSDKNTSVDDEPLGQGWTVYEAHIPFLKLSSGRILINIIAVISKTGNHLLRFVKVPTNVLFDRKMKTGFMPTVSGEFYSTGIIEPTLSLARYLDNIWSLEMISGFENNLSGFMFDPLIPDIEKFAPTWKKGIDVLWQVPGISQNSSVIQRIPGVDRERFADKAHQLINSVIDQTTNASSGISARQSNAQTLGQAQLQFQGANQNLSAIARHLDNQYIERTAIFQYWNIYSTMFKVSSDEYGNPAGKIPNEIAIRYWLKAIGKKPDEIEKRLSNPEYILELSESLEENDIRATGTQASINKAETYQLEAQHSQLMAGLPGAQLIKWDKVTRRLYELVGREPDDFVMTDEEIQQQQEEQQMQQDQNQQMADLVINELTSMTNSQTGEPLTQQEIEERAQFLIEMGLSEDEVSQLLDQSQEQPQEDEDSEEIVQEPMQEEMPIENQEVLA